MNNNFFNQNIFKPEEKKDQPFQQNLFGQQQPTQNFNQPFQQPQFNQSSFAQSPFQSNNPSQFNQSSFTQSPFTTQQKPLFQSGYGENKPLFNQQSTIHSFPYSQSFDLDVKKGTNKPKYTPTRQKEMGSYEYQTFIDITLMSDYKDKSTFELRLEDYSLGRKPAQSAVNSFGAMTKENKPLGLGGSSIFSSTTPSSFTPSFTSSNLNTSPSMTTSNLNPSSMSQTGSLFTSSAPSSSIFSSNTTPSTSMFSQPTSSFSPSTMNTPTTSTFSSSNLASSTPLSTANSSNLNQSGSLFTSSTPSSSIFTPSTTQNLNTGTTSMFNTPQTISSGFTQIKPSSSLFPTSTSVFNQPTPIQPSYTSTFTQPSYTSSNFVQNEVKVSDQIAQYVEAKIKRDPYSLEELNLEEFKEEEILPVKKFTKPKFIKKTEDYVKLDLRDKSTKSFEIETIPSQDSLPKLSNVNLIILFKEGKLEYLESVKASDCYLENIQTKLFFSKETVKCLDPIGTGLNKRCRVYVYNVVSDCGIERFVWGLKSCKDRKFVEYDQNEMVYVYEVEHL